MNDEQSDPADSGLDQWIDGLLRSEGAMPKASTALRCRVDCLRRRKRRNLWVLRGMVAAASLGAVLLWPQSVPINDEREVVSAPISIPVASPPATSPPVATFVGRSDMIVVPLESSDPTVTIVRIYPTTITQRRWRREAALQAALSYSPRMSDPTTNGG